MGQRKSVMLIDDDEDDLLLLSEVIQQVDPAIAITVFTFPLDAWRVISQPLDTVPDFIFIDINMPLLTGDKLVQKIRADKRFDDTRIVVCSTTILPKMAHDLRQDGADYVMTKPVQMMHYVDRVTEILS